jgi:hypothetical protein
MYTCNKEGGAGAQVALQEAPPLKRKECSPPATPPSQALFGSRNFFLFLYLSYKNRLISMKFL